MILMKICNVNESCLEALYIITASINAENHLSLTAMARQSVYINQSILCFSIPQNENTILYSNIKFCVLVPNHINAVIQSLFKAHCEQILF